MMRLFAMLRRWLRAWVSPRSVGEDAQRREFVLNLMILGVLALSVSALVQVIIGKLRLGEAFTGASPWVVLMVIVGLLGLYGLSRMGYARVTAYIFVLLFAGIAAAVCLNWGVLLPAGPLMFVLVIVMAGTLVGTRFSLFVTLLVSVMMAVLAGLQEQGITQPSLAWMNDPVGLNDAFGYIFIWCVIALVAWISNREIELSLRRARQSEADLARQRDLLEERVEERTRELREAQLEKILQLNRFADFGRISSGFFHDIINPLTAVSLNLEQLSSRRRSELLQHAITGIRHIEDFAMAARKQVQGHDELRLFNVAEETRGVVAILESKARGAGVTMRMELDSRVQWFGSAVKYHQLVSNLVANAIDAYEGVELERRVVRVVLAQRGGKVILTVTDEGVGINSEHLDYIFDPFFTTKTVDKGTGIGLMIVKRIVEEDFGGTIAVASKRRTGTVFTVTLPKPAA